MVFVSLSLLALTENDVLNIMIVTIELLKANAAAQLYMEVVWYWTGYMEKKRLGTHSAHLAEVYKTKQIQYALFMGIVLVALFPFLQFIAPYDYTDAENFLKIAPSSSSPSRWSGPSSCRASSSTTIMAPTPRRSSTDDTRRAP